ncbi:MAG: DMT family transporter [Acidobacteriota bacterium]|nr:DMT family transporter [Acidobacteriota bacterium]
MNLFFYAFAAAAGMLNTVQAGANAQLRKSLDQPLLAGLVVYGTALAGLLLAALFVHWSRPTGEQLSRTPWWAWAGGILSIASTMAGLLLARKLGSAVFTSLTVTCSLLVSVLLDHFGWVGFEVHRANPLRLIGCGLLVGGLLLVSKF